MDVTSYLLGKKAGGGGDTPTGEISITTNGTVNVKSYATANVNVQPILQSKSITITENGTQNITADSGYDGLSNASVTVNVSGGGGLDWSVIGYSGEPQSIINGYNYAKNILDNWDSTGTSLNSKFKNDYDLIFLPLVDTSNAVDMKWLCNNCGSLLSIASINTGNVTNMYGMFLSCVALRDVPILNTSKVTNFTNVFSGCRSLTNASLDNILQMCINATSYSGTKTLVQLAISSTYYPASRIQALPHYQDFINAGWTIGY